MDDLTIIELYFDRSEQAIDETDKKYGKLCRSLAGSILSSDEDAEECVSDAYLSVWNTIPPTRPNNFTAFLCRIVRNLSLKRLDYNTAQKRNGNVTVPLAELEEVLHTSPEPEAEELGKLISRFLRQEKADARNVFIRRYYFFDTVADIAERYSFSESKVKSMLYHTRNRLRAFLKKEGIYC